MALLDQPDECLPVYTFQELMSWQPKYQSSCKFAVESLSNMKYRCKQPRTLVCHDMKGGYLEDRFPQGAFTDEAYRFFHWPQVDIFVYFSHYFITIPPPVWINAAHRHNVFILGTFITEWDDGKLRCEELLKSEESYKTAANQLVAIAKHHGFDGWLINIENQIQAEKVQILHAFVEYLTNEMHKAVDSSIVLWYDSVIETGELKWQDQLNDKNKLFFDVCDGIFLNYTWSEEKLKNSSVIAKDCDRPFDVYVGVDVFGRNCFGGGGFNTNKAVEVARRNNMSVSLFAQGWVYEKAEGNMQLFTENEYKFWSLLAPYLQKHCLTNLPFYTSFCQGQGHCYYENGEVISKGPWTNMTLQSLQPGIVETHNHGNMKQTVTFNESFQGGGCLSIDLNFQSSEDYFCSELFNFDVALPKETLFLYTLKTVDDDTYVFMDVTLQVNATNEALKYRLCTDDNMLNAVKNAGSSSINTVCVTSYKLLEGLKEVAVVPDFNGEANRWQTRAHVMENLEGYTLKSVSVCVMCKNNVTLPCRQAILLGQIQISERKDLLPVTIQDLEITSSKITMYESHMATVTCVLQWLCDLDQAKFFNIYYTEVPTSDKKVETSWRHVGRRLHGKQLKNRFKIFPIDVNMNDSEKLLFKVQPVYYNGKSVILSDVPSVHFDIMSG